nr:serine protease FAM111A-like [Misgurnus anguillicaudatus]XP_055054344.1 serine protease FAM111A-like [Misgurnus anguillicaudatus]XP_055054345.1 serine protease FAM111A-like [Misgurnus anguillicaudatus]
MSEAPPPKKMKQTDIRTLLGHSHPEGEIHVFQFRIGYKKHKVACTTSQTVLDALNENDAFKSHHNKHINKEMIIQRAKGKVPGAAVKTDFPCCLLENDEILDINFISNEGNISANQKVVEPSVKPSPLSKYKAFYIRTRGKIRIRVMKNNELALKVDYVCVYALKGETLKSALQRDGRFSDEIFSSPCELMDIFKDASYELSLPVDSLSEHLFNLYVQWQKQTTFIPQSSAVIQYEKANLYVQWQKRKSFLSQSSAEEDEEAPADPPTGERHINEKQKKKRKEMRKTKKGTGSLTKRRMIDITWNLENSSILPLTKEILHAQCKHLFEKLKEPNNLELKKLFEVEYGKSMKNFCEVSTMKELTKFSDSVCVIVSNISAKGTGFLLFDKFVLTNAHVVKDLRSQEGKLLGNLQAVFNYEHVKSKVECLPFKEDLAAYCYEKDGENGLLDYALLELNIDEDVKYPELLSYYKQTPPPRSGGIYIVGHPNCETKKMENCFIIETENRLQAINNHISENPICPYVPSRCWPYLHENQITYDSCFFHGSSGSPVFDEQCSLIGVHTGGFHYEDNSGESRSVIEFCYSMQSIRKNILETARPDVKKVLQEFERKKANIRVKQEPQQEDVSMESDESNES